MDIFSLAAPIFDMAMHLSGHHKTLVELAEKIKEEANQSEKVNRDKNENNFESKNESADKKLLDLGGGTGELARYLPHDFELTIADPSQAMLQKAADKKYNQKVEHVLADGADLPFEDSQFDYITISDALHHFRDVENGIAEAARVLKDDGALYILEFDPRTSLSKTIIFFEKIAGEPVNFFKPAELSEMLAVNGLKSEYEYYNQSIYILKAEKEKQKN